MVCVVGVRFKKAGKVYYFDPAEYSILPGAKVVVETARGVEYGEVAVGPKDVAEDQVVQPLKKVLRIGNDKDAIVAAENKRKEKEAFSVAQKKIEGHNLEMTLVDVEYTFDGSKIIFYFTAEGRVDFRELVRDLAGVFRTRIEMRQIGVRDEAKLLGGIGPCGRVLCCTSFLGDFAPVSIRMAKDQNLSLNPSKISGLCGRLMCCLRYEQETYEAAKKDPTLAPGYVPPAMAEAGEALEDLEDQPMPAIGIRNPLTGAVSARIARAAGLTERPAREERVPERRTERPERAERPDRPERVERPDRPERLPRGQQGQPKPTTAPERPQRPPQGERQPRQQSQPPQQGQQRRGAQPAGERPQTRQPQRPPQGGRQAQAQPRQQGQRPPVEAVQPGQAEGAPLEERPEGTREPRHRHHRHRRKGGGGPGQGGDKPQGAGPNPQE
jgi:cell fate regulator YaaT (PSP1 superfamily)